MIKPILSIIVIVLSAVFAFLYVKPEYNRTEERRADIKTLSETLKSAEVIKDLIRQTGESLNSIDPKDIERFGVLLPETIDGIRFANNLQGIGVANSIILSGIKVEERSKEDKSVKAAIPGFTSTVSNAISLDRPDPGSQNASVKVPSSEKKYATTKASFSVITTYEKFLLFLDDIEKSLGLITVTSLSFREYQESSNARVSATSGPSLYQYTVEIETYSLK